MRKRTVFVTGGTGYLGQCLIPTLLENGHLVKALVRPQSQSKLPNGVEVVLGNALDSRTFVDRIKPSDTFVQLVGVPHPSPAKTKEFRTIDLASIQASVEAAAATRVEHFVYVSVAQPAPVMKAYQAVRAEGEKLLQASGLSATILRPWYILGPGHWWPTVLIPLYWLFERLPRTRAGAQRMGLVRLAEVIRTLSAAVESPPKGVRILEVPQIRKSGIFS